MKVLLRVDVDGVGHKGDILDVADGFARNYLVPKGFAIKATDGIERQAVAMRRSREVADTAARAKAEEQARALVPAVITITARSGAEGKLFGSVTNAEIAEAVEAQTGIALDRKVLHLDEPIKTTGSHAVSAKLHAEVQIQLQVEVVSA